MLMLRSIHPSIHDQAEVAEPESGARTGARLSSGAAAGPFGAPLLPSLLNSCGSLTVVLYLQVQNQEQSTGPHQEGGYVQLNVQINKSVRNRIYLGLVPFLRRILSDVGRAHRYIMNMEHGVTQRSPSALNNLVFIKKRRILTVTCSFRESTKTDQ